eukprot:1323234-Pleurochrysis_carterae.AAC.1
MLIPTASVPRCGSPSLKSCPSSAEPKTCTHAPPQAITETPWNFTLNPTIRMRAQRCEHHKLTRSRCMSARLRESARRGARGRASEVRHVPVDAHAAACAAAHADAAAHGCACVRSRVRALASVSAARLIGGEVDERLETRQPAMQR